VLQSPSNTLLKEQAAAQVSHCPIQREESRAWDSYVLGASEANHCHLSGWSRVVARSYGHASHYLWGVRGGQVVGVLPLIDMTCMGFRRTVVSMPFLDDGGVCADDDEVKDLLAQEAIRHYEARGAKVLDLRHRRPNGLHVPRVGDKVAMVLDLRSDPDDMWKGFDAKLRNQTRKASKSGLVAEWSSCDRLGEFYEVFAANMRDLGSPVHSRRFFEVIFEEFPDSAKLMVVRNQDQVIGGAICLVFQDMLIVPWASSLREYFTLCPNNLLYWEMIRWGCENGFRRFDFGRSSPDSGTYRFKKQWGTREEPLHWQSVSRYASRGTATHADGSKHQWVTKAWSRLPLVVTKLVGPLLRGQISN
jgi:serine/alanine adding enzyme